MNLFFKLNVDSAKCINACTLFNDYSEFSYWENREATNDEKYISNYLKDNNLLLDKKILHVGIGNSHIAINATNFMKIEGITLSKNEIDYGKKLNISNYDIYFQNKYSNESLFLTTLNYYDIIIDVNLKSFSCCDEAFGNLFKIYSKMLNPKGMLITGREGIKWSRQIKPVLSFSLKKFFYRRLKEFNGPNSNMLNEDDCFKLAQKFNLSLDLNDLNIIIFKKK